MIFLDASALVAIITREEDGPALSRRLAAAEPRITSALAVWEATLAVARSERVTLDLAEIEVRALLGATRTTIVPIGLEEARVVL